MILGLDWIDWSIARVGWFRESQWGCWRRRGCVAWRVEKLGVFLSCVPLMMDYPRHVVVQVICWEWGQCRGTCVELAGWNWGSDLPFRPTVRTTVRIPWKCKIRTRRALQNNCVCRISCLPRHRTRCWQPTCCRWGRRTGTGRLLRTCSWGWDLHRNELLGRFGGVSWLYRIFRLYLPGRWAPLSRCMIRIAAYWFSRRRWWPPNLHIMRSETSADNTSRDTERTHTFPDSLVEKKRHSLFPLGLSVVNTTLPVALRDIDADFRVCMGELAQAVRKLLQWEVYPIWKNLNV